MELRLTGRVLEGTAGNDHAVLLLIGVSGDVPRGHVPFLHPDLCFLSSEDVTREIARAGKRVPARSSGHQLRHSRATDLLASTHRIKAVSRLLGHSDEAVTLPTMLRGFLHR